MDSVKKFWDDTNTMKDKAQYTVVDSYNEVFSATGTSSVPTAFPFGIKSGDMDLLTPANDGTAGETKAYRLEFVMKGVTAGTGVVAVTGAAEGGPEEYICDVGISSVGAIVESGSFLIIDSMTLNSFHLDGCSIAVADSGNSRVAKLGFDAIGYRYIRFYVPTLTTITDLRIFARHF